MDKPATLPTVEDAALALLAVLGHPYQDCMEPAIYEKADALSEALARAGR